MKLFKFTDILSRRCVRRQLLHYGGGRVLGFKFQCTVVCNVAHYPSVQCAVVCMCRPLPISTYLPMLSMLSLCARCKHSRDKALFLLLVRGYQNTSRNSARLRRLMLGASSPEQFLHDIYSGLPVEA